VNTIFRFRYCIDSVRIILCERIYELEPELYLLQIVLEARVRAIFQKQKKVH
jgi:hypothetical protein